MIRRCAVFGCDNTNVDTLCHRFPENKQDAQDWKESLKLKEFPIELLQSKFSVCTEHFSDTDYDNGRQLLATAIPKLEDRAREEQEDQVLVQVDEVNSSVSVNVSNSIEIAAPTRATMALLHPHLTRPMHNSCHSTSSTNNTVYSHDDICILETHESHYGMDSFASQHNCILMQSIDAPDFTVLNAEGECKYTPGQIGSPYPLEESTEVILDHSECRRNPSHAISATDSDVEILMSEEVLDSDWSAGNCGIVELSSSDGCAGEEDEKPVIYANTDQAENIPSSVAFKFQEWSDNNIAGEDFSFSSMDAFEQLTRAQLINVIREQAAKIRRMEDSLNRYRVTQSNFFQHVDALRAEFEGDIQQTDGDGSAIAECAGRVS